MLMNLDFETYLDINLSPGELTLNNLVLCALNYSENFSKRQRLTKSLASTNKLFCILNISSKSGIITESNRLGHDFRPDRDRDQES